MKETIKRLYERLGWRTMFFGKEESVEVNQQCDYDTGKPEFLCSIEIRAHHIDVTTAEALVNDIKAAITQARTWNRGVIEL